MPDPRPLDWGKVLDKLKTEARQDVHNAEHALQRARGRLTLLEALSTHHAAHPNGSQ